MKNTKRALGSRLSLCLTGILLVPILVSLLPANASNAKNEMKDFAKNAHPGATVVFTEEDITANTVSDSSPAALLVSGLPDKDTGALLLGEKELREGNIIPTDLIDTLTFVPKSDAEFSVELGFIPLASSDAVTQGAFPITVTLNFSKVPNSPPVSAQLELETYENMPLEINLSAYDHDGDELSYSVVEHSGNGSLVFEDGRLVFYPAEDRTGKFSLVYFSKDSMGNTSGLTEAVVTVSKNRSDVSYADVSDRTKEYYAVRLAKEEVFRGELYGNVSTLASSRSFSKTEFSALCASALGLNRETDAAISTHGIPEWQTPYVETAVSAGSFDGTDLTSPVTLKSAVYIAVSLLEESLGTEITSDSLCFARDCGIVPMSADLDSRLSREEALEIICKTLDVSKGKVLGWRTVAN